MSESEGSSTPSSLPGLTEDDSSDDDDDDFWHPDNQERIQRDVNRIEQTLSPASRQRLAEGEWLLAHYSARQFFALGLERLEREDVERQAALNRALMDARVFKVQNSQLTIGGGFRYRKIFDINSQVQQRLLGQLQDNIHSLDTAKQVFDLETNGLAGFALVKGLVNPPDQCL